MTKQESRKEILTKYVAGEISIDEADEKLEGLGRIGEEDLPEEEDVEEFPPVESQKAEIPEGFNQFKYFWLLPFAVGILFTLWGGFGIYNQYMKNGLSFGFWMAWLPLFLGVVIVTLSVSSSKGHWIHVRVNTGKDEWPRRIVISLPLPTALLKIGAKGDWKFNADGFGDAEGQVFVSDLLEALEESDQPLVVNVDGDDGEKVKVVIW